MLIAKVDILRREGLDIYRQGWELSESSDDQPKLRQASIHSRLGKKFCMMSREEVGVLSVSIII